MLMIMMLKTVFSCLSCDFHTEYSCSFLKEQKFESVKLVHPKFRISRKNITTKAGMINSRDNTSLMSNVCSGTPPKLINMEI